MRNNKGYAVESFMRKWFKGHEHEEDCVDFYTKNILYEVKSCNLYLICSNNNYKRDYKVKPHKKIETTQLGRFFVRTYNHKLIKAQGDLEKRAIKYIFVITVGNQKIWTVKDWAYVDKLISKDKDKEFIRIRDIFKEV